MLGASRAGRLLALSGASRDRPATALALRRSALRVEEQGPITAVVRTARTTPELTRLTVEVDDPAGSGVLDAVAPLGVPVGVGERVRLRLDLTRTASLEDLGPGA